MIVGIDLGTTNSLIGYVDEQGQAHVITNTLGHSMTPSVVSLDRDGSMLVGSPARERLISHPKKTAALFKRSMGTDTKQKLAMYGHSYRPEVLSSFVLKALKEDAEAFLGQPITEAVISVPAYFSDPQRKATMAAGTLAGLKVRRLVNEPTAAALHFGIHQSIDEASILVLDLGGGTFDVSLLELYEGVIEVHASAGNNHLGGQDWTDVVLNDLREQLIQQDVNWTRLKETDQANLLALAESVKKSLSTELNIGTTIQLNNKVITLAYNRNRFEEQSKNLMRRMRDPIERALNDARINPNHIDHVVLVGGATRMPMIHQFAARIFKRFPESSTNPDDIVAKGAAIQAALLSRNRAFDERVLTDVAPYSMGIKIRGHKQLTRDQFSPIIERNSAVPVSHVERFQTADLGQKAVRIQVYQGESHDVARNLKLGELTVDVPVNQENHEEIDVRFTYNVNGLLEVEVTTLSTGVVRTIIIEKNPGLMTSKQIEETLAELAEIKIHPRDQMINRQLLAKCHRLYEQTIGRERSVMSVLITKFEAILEKQDPDSIKNMRQSMKQEIASIEEGLFNSWD